MAIHDASSPPGSGGPAATHTPRPEEATHQTAWLRQAASGTSVSVCDRHVPKTSKSNPNFPVQCRTFPEQWCSFRTNADA